jgi:hypothetical protein
MQDFQQPNIPATLFATGSVFRATSTSPEPFFNDLGTLAEEFAPKKATVKVG